MILQFFQQLGMKGMFRSSYPEVFLRKGVLKICSKLTGKHQCRSVISIKLLWNFIEITLRHGCSPVNLLHIFRTPFPKNTSEQLLLCMSLGYCKQKFYPTTIRNIFLKFKRNKLEEVFDTFLPVKAIIPKDLFLSTSNLLVANELNLITYKLQRTNNEVFH